MKIFVNKDIKNFFIKLFICVAIYILSALFIVCCGFNKVFLIATSLIIMLLMIAFGIIYFKRQNKILENAAKQITDYLSGNQNATIECNEEGELYRLFHEVNNLVSVLNAHAENESKSKEFLKDTISDISHQLKTPLAALNIYNGLISDTEDLSEVKHFSLLSDKELDRIESLVQNLLKITRFDAGTIVIDKKHENVSDLMSNIFEQFSFRAESENKKIELNGKNDIDLLCDKGWILEAVGNIVKNALDHTKSGDTIHIEWKRFASVVQIIIKDNGNGIHTEDLNHIFKRFYRSRFSQDTKGIGFGLSLAKTIIEQHNGSIIVSSEPQIGTTFTINFLITTKL